MTSNQRDDRDHRHIRLLLSFLLAPEANCVDVGAYEGLVLAEMVRLAPRGRHIAYEPLPDRAEVLRRSFPGVEVRQRAVSDAARTAIFHRALEHPAYSGLLPPDGDTAQAEPFELQTESLDEALPPGYRPALIKIDVEGAEEQVLAGATRTLAEHRPTVILEHGVAARLYGTTTRRIFELLSGAGLRVFDIDGAGPYDVRAMEQVVAVDKLWTWFAHR